MTMYKTFARPHLDYGDIIYDQAYNETFHQKLESIQYNALVALPGATGSLIGRLGIPPTSTLVQKTLLIL